MTQRFHPWVGARTCTSGPQPGVMAFMRWAIEAYGRRGAMNWGIYNCRNVAGTPTTSVHGEGRAGDVGFPIADPDGDLFLRALLNHAWELGLQAIIYERRIYSAQSPQGRPYTGVHPHHDHLHVEFTWDAARRLTYAAVKRIMGGGWKVSPTPTIKVRTVRQAFLEGGETEVNDVKHVQRTLNGRYYLGLAVDGYAGKYTVAGMRIHQRAINSPNRTGIPGRYALKRLSGPGYFKVN